MNNKIIAAIIGILFIATPVLAVSWTTNLNIDTSTDRLHNSVSGGFNSGTFAYNVDTTTSTHSINTNANVSGSDMQISTDGIDTTFWHPGQVGQSNSFVGQGLWSGTYSSSTNGNYGILNSYVNANANSGGADFVMTDTQYFNIMSGNHNNNVVGNFYAHANGTDNQVAMNMKSVGSMYVWSEATNPYSTAPLSGSLIEKEVWTTKNGSPNTDLYVGVQTNGTATMSNSNIWGWTNGETGTSSTNYGGGTRTVSATGSGQVMQTGSGAHSLSFNGFAFGAGNALFSGSFTGGMSGTYNMSAS